MKHFFQNGGRTNFKNIHISTTISRNRACSTPLESLCSALKLFMDCFEIHHLVSRWRPTEYIDDVNFSINWWNCWLLWLISLFCLFVCWTDINICINITSIGVNHCWEGIKMSVQHHVYLQVRTRWPTRRRHVCRCTYVKDTWSTEPASYIPGHTVVWYWDLGQWELWVVPGGVPPVDQ